MDQSPPALTGRLKRSLWMAAGIILVAAGCVGIVVPLMPTVVFWILAAACFARSSPRLEQWMLTHPRIGPPVMDWRTRRAIPVRGKVMAVIGMSAGYAILLFAARPELVPALAVASALLATAAWILTRPS